MKLAGAAAVLLAGIVFASHARAEDTPARYVAVILGSAHIGNDDLNDVTPGVLMGLRGTLSGHREWHAEAGVFYNSYREVAPIALAGVSTQIADLGPARLRVGLSGGIGYYRELSKSLEERYGLPNAGGFIPIAALTASLRRGPTEVRLTTVPPDTDTVAIFNLSIARRF